MQRLGSFLVIVGVLAIVLQYFGRAPRILTWIYKWGEGTAWGIKIGLIVVGIVLWFAGRSRTPSSES